VELVKVDPLDAEATKRRFALSPDGGGPQVLVGRRHPIPLIPHHAALGEDVRPLGGRNAIERAPDYLFRVSQPVHGRGVDPIDPPREGVPDRGDRLLVLLRAPAEGPVAATDGPGAEADGRDGHVRVAEPAGGERRRHVGECIAGSVIPL